MAKTLFEHPVRPGSPETPRRHRRRRGVARVRHAGAGRDRGRRPASPPCKRLSCEDPAAIWRWPARRGKAPRAVAARRTGKRPWNAAAKSPRTNIRPSAPPPLPWRETGDDVVVDHAGRPYEGVADRGADEAGRAWLPAHAAGDRRVSGTPPAPVVADRLAIDERPQVCVEVARTRRRFERKARALSRTEVIFRRLRIVSAVRRGAYRSASARCRNRRTHAGSCASS